MARVRVHTVYAHRRNHAHANTAFRRAAERCYAFGLPPGEEVKSSRSADCLNVLRRVYSSYQFPDKYLHFRTHISYFPLTPFRFFFPPLSRPFPPPPPLLSRPRPAIVPRNRFDLERRNSVSFRASNLFTILRMERLNLSRRW